VGNGVTTKIMEEGSTVEELLDASGYELDDEKEVVIARSTGLAVDYDDEIEDGETYQITAEIKSA
jgi:hypothetical protein